jgi:hypothetical protein
MIASDPVRTLPSSCRPGAVHIWVPRSQTSLRSLHMRCGA